MTICLKCGRGCWMPISAYLDQMALDEEIDAERQSQLELEQQQLAQLVAQGNVQPHNQQMPGPNE